MENLGSVRALRGGWGAHVASYNPSVVRDRSSLTDFALCLAASVAWTWPLAARLDRTLRDAYDAATQAWVLAWVGHALTTAPFSLFQANAFAPARDVLAFSEPLVGYGLVGIPLRALGLSPAGVLNALCIFFLAFGAWGVSRLALDLGASRPAALLGAFASSFGALATVQLGFVSFTAFGGIPLSILAWRRLEREPSPKKAVVLGVSLAALGWFSLHLFAFALVPIGLLALWALARPTRSRRLAVLLAASALLAAGLLLPLAVPLLRVRSQEGFSRDQEETAGYSAQIEHWLATTPDNPGQRFLPFRSGAERALYPGTTALALGLVALAPSRNRDRRPLILLGGLLVTVGFLGSLGPSTPFFASLRLLAPPLYGGIRVAARFAFLSVSGFGLLAAAGSDRLVARLPGRRWRGAAFAGVLVGLALDVRQALPWSFRPEAPPPVERFLAGIETGGPILHLPLHLAPPDARVLYASLVHFKPVVNGTLSYIPQRNVDLAETLWKVPIPEGTLERIERWPVGTIVFHEHAMPLSNVATTLRFLESARAAGRLSSPLRFPHAGGTDWVFGVVRVRGDGGWDRRPTMEELDEFRRRAATFPDFDVSEDPSLPASLDTPEEGAVVRGDLLLRGWCQDPAGPGEVVEVAIDADRREPSRSTRTARPDVTAALPALEETSAAGYEVTLPFLDGDEGRHEVRLVFRSKGGRTRTLTRVLDWNPPAKSPSAPPS